MFTWICPQCGREVPPAYTECPDCSVKTPDTAGPPPEPMAPQPNAGAAAPPPAPPPAPPAATPQPEYRFGPLGEPAAPRNQLPTWLLAILFAIGFAGIVGGVYWLVSSARTKSSEALSAPSSNVERAAAKPGAPMHPLQKHIEISGVRFQQDEKKKNVILVTFVVVNHSPADAYGLAGNVTLWSNTRRSDEDAQGTFSFLTDLKGYASKELTVPLSTGKPAVELADWQYLSADVQITGPPFSGGSLLQK